MKRMVEIIITPLYKKKHYQHRFSLLEIRLILIGIGLLVIFAGLGIYLLHYTNQQNLTIRYLYNRNIQLENENKKVIELQKKLNDLELERAKIARMLGADKNPPPIDLSSLEETYQPYPTPERQLSQIKFQNAPTTGYIISRRFSSTHQGIDLATQLGMPVYAVGYGIVEAVGFDTFYGNYIRIDHGDGYKTFYGHLYKTIKNKNESVNAGEIIGYVGTSGKSTAPHLHFEISKVTGNKTENLDPEKELKSIIR